MASLLQSLLSMGYDEEDMMVLLMEEVMETIARVIKVSKRQGELEHRVDMEVQQLKVLMWCAITG